MQGISHPEWELRNFNRLFTRHVRSSFDIERSYESSYRDKDWMDPDPVNERTSRRQTGLRQNRKTQEPSARFTRPSSPCRVLCRIDIVRNSSAINTIICVKSFITIPQSARTIDRFSEDSIGHARRIESLIYITGWIFLPFFFFFCLCLSLRGAAVTRETLARKLTKKKTTG